MTSTVVPILFIQILLSIVVTTTLAGPITITRETFRTCRPGTWGGIPSDCCPPKLIKGPIVDFCPTFDASKPLRVRKALQCLSGHELETYTRKLERGYALMRALPDSDPRSFKRQNAIHCAYGTGSFVQDGSTNLTIDIHLNWLFLPWHRMFVYFHERILQKLLGDPEFSLHFWNFDNSVTATPRHGSHGCYKAGHFMPPIYSDPSKATFEPNRSSKAFEPNRPVDLSLDLSQRVPLSAPIPPFPNRTLEEQTRRNREVMHRSVITLGNTTSFIGKPYRVGDTRVIIPATGAGTIERWPHNTLHVWIGGWMLQPITAPIDPIFYPFHANMERLWSVWRKLGYGHDDPTDPDWLDATFLFWDENAVMRRVKVRDFLDLNALGYRYEEVNDASWIFFDNSTSSSAP
ncbi:polyphenol oxidase [Marchantia polymorpha subsp. ruderalis]|uniref:Tyrosinase copper-binding domain-containing protein n=2 Tax=Marchantia polymorpha TaxID=3197 RepID=A0AAF6AX00_MARPO|nr:hypothetical protein MARPO_0244s0003 [Marchantia polymorpha]BBN04284.1 hypothetical protein Mp_3g03340 [Marchantia polymorpha subsp. ruderalis]|eukprot:PTQ27008.1 hypothetical protein MARPO_0244s0003 [Marchantia polymorpha]